MRRPSRSQASSYLPPTTTTLTTYFAHLRMPHVPFVYRCSYCYSCCYCCGHCYCHCHCHCYCCCCCYRYYRC